MNHVLYEQLVRVRGEKSAYVQYRKDGGTLSTALFNRKYNKTQKS